MLVEDFLIGASRRRDLLADQCRHDFAQDGGVIFRLRLAGFGLDAEALEVAAQARQRTLVQKTRQVIGSVGQELAPAEADEEVKVFTPDLSLLRALGSLAEGGMRKTQGRGVAAQLRQPLQEQRIGTAREEGR